MWVTADAVKGIPDLDQFNDAVDDQVGDINTEITRLDEDNYFDNTSESRIERWEKILELTPRADDTLDERRFAVHSRVIDKLPYTYRVIERELKALAADVIFTCGWGTKGAVATVQIGLTSQSKLADIDALLDKKLPADVVYSIVVLYRRWQDFSAIRWGELQSNTWDQMRSLGN
jgi:hypothetical protein